ncbi:hypothetical protein SLEP1_g17760 [Rubroshorea leprosula]|uniref:Uncharacterized protein n=1 Tax=Rubroshorea leprosula TaxID=152421 RepID=A0AAV5J2V4_9ROSI|nr:hypothetical protein SLEP1_g17760 [Rubroshorea leprosula]
MDENKDDALKCLKIDKNALDTRDQAHALKFLTKARCLDPSLAVDDLLAAARKDSDDRSLPNSGADARDGGVVWVAEDKKVRE